MSLHLLLGQYVQLRVYSRANDQVAENILNYQVVAVGGAGLTLQDMANRLGTVMPTAFKQLLSNQATYLGLSMQQLSGVVERMAVSKTGAGVGTGGATLLPTQVCGLISLYDGLAGRKHRGRIYLPFPSGSANDVGAIPTAGYVTDAVSWLATVLTPNHTIGPDSCTLELVIYHRPTANGDAVAVDTVDIKWATQRRRSVFGRPNLDPI
jgi:hypothetical protein